MIAHRNLAIERAMQSVAAATPKAETDPSRPVYHFCPPANWMNDPNGTIYHKGYYHLFYQHNPFGDFWGDIHWGHARSRDLIRWEHLPIALWPSAELNEGHCFSGCAAVNDDGRPMLIYTKVAPGEKPRQEENEQWVALGSDDWLTWEKWSGNPLLSLGQQGAPRFRGDWRDPFIFEEAGRTFLIIGGALDDTQEVALYEAEDQSLLSWSYRGPLYARASSEVRFFECPNFLKLGEKWVLLTSPFNLVEYVVGTFDVKTLTFTPETEGIIDYGAGYEDPTTLSGSVPNFYASNALYDPAGRCILFGWIRGWQPDRSWSGTLTLPRVLTLGPDNRPRQAPLPELDRLRTKRLVQHTNLTLESGERHLESIEGDTLELRLALARGSANACGIKLRCSKDGVRHVSIRYDGQTLHVAGTAVPLTLTDEEPTVNLHIFLDRSALEVFVNDGRLSVTRVIDPQMDDLGVALFAEGGTARVMNLEAWEMGSIW